MKLDILIKNGLVADLDSGSYINQNIGIVGNRIVDLHTAASQALRFNSGLRRGS